MRRVKRRCPPPLAEHIKESLKRHMAAFGGTIYLRCSRTTAQSVAQWLKDDSVPYAPLSVTFGVRLVPRFAGGTA